MNAHQHGLAQVACAVLWTAGLFMLAVQGLGSQLGLWGLAVLLIAGVTTLGYLGLAQFAQLRAEIDALEAAGERNTRQVAHEIAEAMDAVDMEDAGVTPINR